MSRSRRLVAGLTGLFTLCHASSGVGATYYIVQSGPDAWTVMDPKGIEAIPGDGVQRRAWVVRVQRNILTGDPPQPGYVRTLSEYDCVQTRVRWREFSAYSRSGAALVSKRNPNPEWGPASETADINAAFRVVCQGQGGGSVVSADSIAKVVISLMGSWDPPPTVTVPAAVPAAKVAPARKSPPPKPN